MNGKKDWAFGVLVSIALGVSMWSLKWTFTANTQLALLQQSVNRIADDTETDRKQNETLTKFWKILSWDKDRITELRNTHGLALMPWPDLD